LIKRLIEKEVNIGSGKVPFYTKQISYSKESGRIFEVWRLGK
jgi:hypothetical protein